ncbi:hypothetical protein Q1695_003928 [Nippostrongylus brasiliensis]|nr:hypothetical protein Q1695_003928 [Nippostrongylus brasiliensis]
MEPSTEIRLLLASTYLILSIVGIIPNILFAIMLYRSRRKIGQVSFFALAGQILACDLGQLSTTQLVVAFPLSLWGTNIYKGYTTIWIYTIFNVIDTISYNGVLWFTFVMAVNRLTVFIMPKLHQLLFSPSVVWRSIVLVWCVILVQVAGVNVLQCWKQFSYNKFYFYIRCYNSSSTLSFIWLDVMRYLSFALPVIMFVFYIYLFVFLRLTSPSHHGASRTSMVAARKTEINLLIQAVVVTAFLELQTLSFTFLPKLGTGFGEYYSSLAQNVISILNNSINPYVYFFINKQIRNEFLILLCRKNFFMRKRARSVTKIYDLSNLQY